MTKKEKIRYLLVPAVGFGIGGAFWGLFDVMGSLGSIVDLIIVALIVNSLIVSLSKNVKIFKKIIIAISGAGIWVIVFGLWALWFFLFGLPDYVPFYILCLGSILIFLVMVGIVVIFYALVLRMALKSKAWPVIWRVAVLFIVTFIISLILAGLINNIILFALYGIFLGLFLGGGVYKGQQSLT